LAGIRWQRPIAERKASSSLSAARSRS